MLWKQSEDEREMCARTVYCTNIDKKVCNTSNHFYFCTFMCPGFLYMVYLQLFFWFMGEYRHDKFFIRSGELYLLYIKMITNVVFADFSS